MELIPKLELINHQLYFLNGEYWGILNIRERYDRHFFNRKYGIVEGQLDYLKNDLTPVRR
jgi:hypothetical protein